MLCDPCVSACALLSFALKAPILGTGIANLKTTSSFLLSEMLLFTVSDISAHHHAGADILFAVLLWLMRFVIYNTPKSEQFVVFRLEVV